MGYTTQFELQIHEGDRTLEDILRENLDFYGIDYAVYIDGETVDSVKWYSHEADMVNLSMKYSDIVFSLRGRGEEQGDSWFKYFKGGKMQDCQAKITFDAYDESKLITRPLK